MEQIQFMNFFSWVNTVFSYKPFAFCLFLTFIFCKSFLLIIVNTNRKRAVNQIPLLLFAIPLVTYMIGETAWIIFMLPYSIFSHIFCRMAWHVQPLQLFSLGLFLHSIVDPKYILSTRATTILKLLFSFIFIPIIPFLLYPFIPTAVATTITTSFPFFIINEIFFRVGNEKELLIDFVGFSFLIFNMISVYRKIQYVKEIPYILRLQIKTFFTLLSTFIVPELILFFCKFFPSLYFLKNNLPITILSSALFTSLLLFYARKIYQLRFLNLTSSVHDKQGFIAHDELRKAKQALTDIQSISETPHVHAEFFKNVGITSSPEQIQFMLRVPFLQEQLHQQTYTENYLHQIEEFLQNNEEIADTFFHEDSVLVYDELAFTHFYQQSKSISTLLGFLNTINAAVFVPLKQKNRFLGFLVIQKHETEHELLPASLQTLIGLYGTYVTYTISRFLEHQYEAVLCENEQLSLELYKARQKIGRYQESLSSIMKTDDIKKQGLVLYKHGIFTLINTAAEQLLTINPNIHHGHPLTRALKEVVRLVESYGHGQEITEKNIRGQEICCYAFPYKKDEVFILIALADVVKTLKAEHSILSPSDIDYFVFLHTTEAGSIINTAIPSKGESLQKFKLHFLKTVLSKKAIVLDVHPDDFDLFTDMAKQICARTTVYTIDLQTVSIHSEISSTLFGAQQFDAERLHLQKGVLDHLDQNGILCIKNVHLLDFKTQEVIAQFLKTGSFSPYKAEIKKSSDVMLLFSSTADLKQLASQGSFSNNLFEHLHEHIVSFPSFSALPFSELETFAEGLQKQLIPVAEYHHLFGFSVSERENLDVNRPISIHQLKERVASCLRQRISQTTTISENTVYNSQKSFSDPLLIEAARLGKHALKDRKIIRALWEKLHSQSKIAQLLSVDRSSVHRRFKEFGIS